MSVDIPYKDGYYSFEYAYFDRTDDDTNREYVWLRGIPIPGHLSAGIEIPPPPYNPSTIAKIQIINSFDEPKRVYAEDARGRRGFIGLFNTPSPKNRISLIQSGASDSFDIPVSTYKLYVLPNVDDQNAFLAMARIEPLEFELFAGFDRYEINLSPEALNPGAQTAPTASMLFPAQVNTTNPAQIPIDGTIELLFTKPMIRPLVEKSIMLKKENNDDKSPFYCFWSSDNKKLTLRPYNQWEQDKLYHIYLGRSACDLYGTRLRNAIDSSFFIISKTAISAAAAMIVADKTASYNVTINGDRNEQITRIVRRKLIERGYTLDMQNPVYMITGTIAANGREYPRLYKLTCDVLLYITDMNGRNIHIPEFIYNHTFYDEAGLTEE
ncbi:MAG: Ig-like domain-containing protein, partial [Treponema sp.]|nr:Ig-like domain-containing protein [Treponema sp.]